MKFCVFSRVGLGLVALFAAMSAGAQEQSVKVGLQWKGMTGLKATVQQIQMRDALMMPRVRWIRKMTERMGPERRGLENDPAALAIASSGSRNSYGPGGHDGGPNFSIGTGFTGVNATESLFMPPDTQGDVSPNSIIVVINGRIKSFSKAGVLGSLNADLDTFFSSVHGGPGTADPRVRFDRLTNKWIVTAMSMASTNNRICLAVSDGPTISASTVFTFFFFQQNTVAPSGNTNQFFDYPTLGVDSQALYIGGNCFDASGNFINTSAFVVKKSSVTGAGPIVVSAFRNLINGTSGTGAWTPQGVDNDDPSSTDGFFIGVDNAVFGKLDIYKVTNPGTSPAMSTTPVFVSGVGTTSFPTDVSVNGSARPLDSLDDRLFMARIQTNANTGAKTLWTTHNISVSSSGVAVNSGSAGARTAGRWYEITGFSGASPSVVQLGTVFDPASTNPKSFWIPSIATNRQGHSAIGFSYGGAADRAGAGFTFRLSGDSSGSTRTPLNLQSGLADYNLDPGSPQRWGDYSATTVDPTDGMTVWTFQEFCSATNTYAVHVRKLIAPPPAAIATINPTSHAADGVAFNMTVVGTSSSGSGFFDPGSTFSSRLAASFSGTGVTVNSVTYTDPTHLTLNVTVAATAAAGTRNLTITNPDGQSVTANGIFTVNAGAAVLSSITVTPTSKAGGATPSPTVKVTLLSAAPTGGQIVVLTSSNPTVASLPASITIPAGKTSGTATLTTSPVASDTAVTLTATAGSDSKNTTFTVLAPTPKQLNISPSTVTGGSSATVTGTVILTGPAPTGGVTVTLQSTNTAVVTVPANVSIAAGATSGSFNVTTFPVSTQRSPSVKATLNGVTKSKQIIVNPPTVKTVVVSPVNAVGGSSTTVTATVKLNANAPTGGITVALSDDSAAASLPASVLVPAGTDQATVNVTHTSVASNTAVTITGTTGAVTASDTLNLLPPNLSTLTFSPTTVVGGSSTAVTGTVTINAPAPAGGTVVTLSSNDTAAATVPASVTIPAGATSTGFTITHKAVTSQHIVTISATAGTVTKTKTLTVNQ